MTVGLGPLMIVEPGLRLWGSERALCATLPALARSWPKIILITPPGAELAAEVSDHPDHYAGIEVQHADIGNLHRRGKLARLNAMVALWRMAIRHQPARIYLNQAGLIRLLYPVARYLMVPFVVHVRLLEDNARVTAIRASSAAPIYKIFVSEAMLEAAERSSTSSDNLILAYDPYPFVVIDRTAPVAPLVAVGRLSFGKGLHLLVDALAHPNLSGVSLDVFGVGVQGDDYASRLEDEVTRKELDIKFLGFDPFVKRHLPRYRFLVLTSKFESLGRVVMEAWEAGVVPIAYEGSGGAAEIIKKSGGGLLFSHWTSESLRQTLATALALTEMDRLRLSDAGRVWMEENLSLPLYTSTLRGVLF